MTTSSGSTNVNTFQFTLGGINVVAGGNYAQFVRPPTLQSPTCMAMLNGNKDTLCGKPTVPYAPFQNFSLCKDHQPQKDNAYGGGSWIEAREQRPCAKCSRDRKVVVRWVGYWHDPQGHAQNIPTVDITWNACCRICALEAKAEKHEKQARELRERALKMKAKTNPAVTVPLPDDDDDDG